jgi:hypothetical protein
MRSQLFLLIAALTLSPSCASRNSRDAPQRAAHAAATQFTITSDFGEESAWVEPYLHEVGRALVRLMDAPEIAPPETIHVDLRRDPNLPGLGGYATPDRVAFVSDQWPKDANRLWIIAHEMANLYAHRYAAGGGFPSDFWSNGRSPFPEYVSCIVLREAGYPEEAVWRKVTQKGKPDHDLYWRLDERYGFDLFARFFKLLREDGVVINDLGDQPWPAPDRARSLATIGYLSIAAGSNLAPLFRAAGVGREPEDWRDRHPEIEFREYSISDAEVEEFIAARRR